MAYDGGDLKGAVAIRTVFVRSAVITAVFVSSFGTAAAIAQSVEASLTVSGTIGGESAAAPGPILNEGLPSTLAFTVTNTGGETLSGLTLSDTVLGAIECPVVSLAPGASTVCERSTEAVRGRYRSSTFATALAPDGAVVTQSFRVGYHGKKTEWKPDLDVELVFDGGSLRWPGPTLATGDPIEFVYRVVNTGTVPLRNLKVVPAPGFEVTCPIGTIQPGQSVDCEATGTVGDGRYKGKISVVAWDDRGTRVKASRLIHYLGEEKIVVASFAVDVVAGGRPAGAAPGPLVNVAKPLRWTMSVTNDGEDDLWGLYAWDSEVGAIPCNAAHIAPGDSATCRVTTTATTGPMSGQIEMTAWASDGRQIVSRIDRYAFGIQAGAGLSIETYVDGFDADSHAGPRRVNGDTLEMTYVISNVGTVTMRNVRVSDQLFGAITCPTRRLAPGASMTCSYATTAALGWWETTGTATGRGGDQKVRASDKTFWHVRTAARISVIDLEVSIGGHDTDGGTAPAFAAGTRVEVVYRARNAGNSPLWSLEIRDPQVAFSDMTCSGSDDPGPGDALVCRATIVVEGGAHWLEIEAVAWNSDGTRIVGKDSLRYSGIDGAT